MAWIESHTTLARHPKTIRLARHLGMEVPAAIGTLHLLWWWALEYAQDGDLSSFDDQEIADAVLWTGDPAQLRRALTCVGFLDEDGQIHDWEDYAGRLLEKKRVNAERMRVARAARVASLEERALHVQRTCDERAGLPYLTVPNLTGPDRTGGVTRARPQGGRDAPATPTHTPISPEEIEQLVAEFGPVLGESAVREKIARAHDRRARLDYEHEYAYVLSWLRADAADQQKELTHGRSIPQRNGSVRASGRPGKIDIWFTDDEIRKWLGHGHTMESILGDDWDRERYGHLAPAAAVAVA